MLYDVRTYVCRPGTIKAHLALYAKHGYAIQKRHLGAPALYLQTETGDVNAYIHIWVFKNAADRATRRSELQADPDWVAYLKRSADAAYLIRQTNTLMTEVMLPN